MRIRATAASAVLLLAALTACGGGSDSGSKTASPEGSPIQSVDCSDQSLDQATWMEECAGEAGTGGDGTEGVATGLKFGESYTWPDGLTVTVVEAKVFTDYDPEYESAEPGETDFRVTLKLTNGGKQPVDLGDLSTIVEGATRGGEAAGTSFERGSLPLEGRLAPGVTVAKNDDNVLEARYGTKIVVTVQRSSENFDLEFPEFAGEIIS
ncbi:MAG TPA: hypothetical protein VFY14_02825 [Streptomyces sp.]|nr:hypothetical protein [Streptomyces sp.]